MDRYAGLTLETKASAYNDSKYSNEFFDISENKNSEIASICEQRRNLKRLSFHQKLAANEFTELISDIFYRNQLSQNLYSQFLEFAFLIKDFEMQTEIKKLFSQELQTIDVLTVKQRENDLWNTEQPNPLKTATLSMSFPSMKATTSLRSKD
ncbi:MAG TPA: hypothetical protein PKY59_06815 [Pyrinomonadaceae bacterium]|nr:hypothetical protein [Pyrinomonadaceae bacterium]